MELNKLIAEAEAAQFHAEKTSNSHTWFAAVNAWNAVIAQATPAFSQGYISSRNYCRYRLDNCP